MLHTLISSIQHINIRHTLLYTVCRICQPYNYTRSILTYTNATSIYSLWTPQTIRGHVSNRVKMQNFSIFPLEPRICPFSACQISLTSANLLTNLSGKMDNFNSEEIGEISSVTTLNLGTPKLIPVLVRSMSVSILSIQIP